MLIDQYCLDIKSPYRQAYLVKVLLQKYKHKVFHKRKWQQGIELSLFMLSLVEDKSLAENFQQNPNTKLLSAVTATMPHKIASFLFLAAVSHSVRADCPEFDDEPQIDSKNTVSTPMLYSKQKMLRQQAENYLKIALTENSQQGIESMLRRELHEHY